MGWAVEAISTTRQTEKDVSRTRDGSKDGRTSEITRGQEIEKE